MDIITIFNYPDDEKYNQMFKVWLYSAIQSKLKTEGIDDIVVYSKQLSPACIDFIKMFSFDWIKVLDGFQIDIPNAPNYKWKHNVGYKLYTLCNQTKPYIFIDADTIILTDMTNCVKASKDKPLIGVNHQTIQGHTAHFKEQFINTGFLIVSEPSFLNFNRIVNMPIRFNVPGTDQKLIYNYCRTMKYDYTHPLIHWGWNSCANFKKEVNGKIISDGVPEKHPVHVLHYWDRYKPWITPCRIYKSYTDEIYLLTHVLKRITDIPYERLLPIYHESFQHPIKIGVQTPAYMNDCKIINIKGTNEQYIEGNNYDFVV